MTGTTPPPSAIRAYLDTSGWTRHPGPSWSRDGRCVDAPDWLAPDLVEEVLAVIARAEGRAAGDVARSVEALAKAKGDPPPDEFEAVRNVAAMLGMDRPAPALGERSTAATELTEGTRIQLARAEHIARCWLNPAVRSCKTCANLEPGGDACGCEPGCNWGSPSGGIPDSCAAGIDLDGTIKTGCPLWRLREKS